MGNSVVILGVGFCTGVADEVVTAGLRGGLVVIPSAPVLVRMTEDAAHREALLNADLAITDSGLMVLLWRLLKREKLERVSGLEYLKLLLERLKPTTDHRPRTTDTILWVMPTEAARERNVAWLRSQGFTISTEDCYVAPVYAAAGPLMDEKLRSLIRQRRPAHIILALGGGVQERLGYSIMRELEKDQKQETRGQGPKTKPVGMMQSGDAASHTAADSNSTRSQLPAPSSQLPTLGSYRPGIHCVGAAIGFLTGDQVRIPMWADYLYLGWLFRCLSAPRRFVPRYWKAARLVGLMWRYGAEAPPVNEMRDGGVPPTTDRM